MFLILKYKQNMTNGSDLCIPLTRLFQRIFYLMNILRIKPYLKTFFIHIFLKCL